MCFKYIKNTLLYITKLYRACSLACTFTGADLQGAANLQIVCEAPPSAGFATDWFIRDIARATRYMFEQGMDWRQSGAVAGKITAPVTSDVPVRIPVGPVPHVMWATLSDSVYVGFLRGSGFLLHYIKSSNIVYRANNVQVDARFSIQYFKKHRRHLDRRPVRDDITVFRRWLLVSMVSCLLITEALNVMLFQILI
jgi:hypothetical protein